MAIKLGNLTLRHGLMLAPMAGVTDRSFRRICRRFGAEYTVTEMVSAKALHYQDEKSLELAKIPLDDQPSSVQLFGHEPDILQEAIGKILTPREYSAKSIAIDLNMGCPMKKIVNNGDGSALMKTPELAGRLIRAAVEASDVPVTVKIRTGWNESFRNAVEIAKIAEDNGAALICVHGRTREQMYQDPVDLDTIAAVKRAVYIPVVGNGGIASAEDAARMLETTGCDGLMIARGAMGNPWLFEAIAAYLEGKPYAYPDLDIRIAEALRQVEDMIEDKGERIGVMEARRHLAYYIKDRSGAAEARNRLNAAESLEEIYEIVNVYLTR